MTSYLCRKFVRKSECRARYRTQYDWHVMLTARLNTCSFPLSTTTTTTTAAIVIYSLSLSLSGLVHCGGEYHLYIPLSHIINWRLKFSIWFSPLFWENRFGHSGIWSFGASCLFHIIRHLTIPDKLKNRKTIQKGTYCFWSLRSGPHQSTPSSLNYHHLLSL